MKSIPGSLRLGGLNVRRLADAGRLSVRELTPRNIAHSVFVAVVIIGLAIVAGLVFDLLRVSARSPAADPLWAARHPYAGEYETASRSASFPGGLGLFESGRYVLMVAPDDIRSGTWTLNSGTIWLKDSKSGVAVLKILGSHKLAYDHRGTEVIFRMKADNDPSPSRFILLRYPSLAPD